MKSSFFMHKIESLKMHAKTSKKKKKKKTDGSYVIKPEGDLIIFPAVTLNLLLERQYSVHVLETTEVTSS